MKLSNTLITLIVLCIFSGCTNKTVEAWDNTGNYYLKGDGTVSEEVLKNYLSRAVTHFEFADNMSNSSPHIEDDDRCVLNMGVKFIGRSVFMWGGESRLRNPMWLKEVKNKIDMIHEIDPDIIFQGAIFEYISQEVDGTPIPDFVYKDFGLPVPEEQTFFSWKEIAGNNHELGGGLTDGVPYIGNLMCQMYIYFVACSYMDAGIEAIHFGQAEMISDRNPDHNVTWQGLITKIKAAAKTRARRHTIICDAHMPGFGMKVGDHLVFDFVSFPIIYMPILNPPAYPSDPVKAGDLIEPQRVKLQSGYSNAIWNKCNGGITPSGWHCDVCPYLVEYDNGGISDHPNVGMLDDWMLYGYDCVSWFYMQPEWYRNEILVYSYEWLRENDPNGFLQPLSRRCVTIPTSHWGTYYYANSKSDMCPDGMGQEETIKKIWGNDDIDFSFEAGIADNVLRNYLDKAVTMADFLSPEPYTADGSYPYREDDIRMIKNIKPKFIGRAIYRWGTESAFIDPTYLTHAKEIIDELHEFDTEIIFQGCAFEYASREVEKINIPSWTFKALGLPEENRTFRYDFMADSSSPYWGLWGDSGIVPDITKEETRLWFMFLIGSYINIGCESIHLGQTNLIGASDKDNAVWDDFISKVRKYASENARRKWVLLDSHCGPDDMMVGNKCLLDFKSYPMRIKNLIKERPRTCILEKGYLDSVYGRNKACLTPSGYYSNALPYLVEFDNYGISGHPGTAAEDYFIWGYDEISWLYLQGSPDAINRWLWYADDWIRTNATDTYLQLPVSRVLMTGEKHLPTRFRANIQSSACPVGMDIEDCIKHIFLER